MTPITKDHLDVGFEMGYEHGWNDAIEAAAKFIQKEAGGLHQLSAEREKDGLWPVMQNEAARLDSHAAAIRKLEMEDESRDND